MQWLAAVFFVRLRGLRESARALPSHYPRILDDEDDDNADDDDDAYERRQLRERARARIGLDDGRPFGAAAMVFVRRAEKKAEKCDRWRAARFMLFV